MKETLLKDTTTPKQQTMIDIPEKLEYNQPFLLQNCKSAEFLEAISYRIDLTRLYRVVDSCYYDTQGQYCPIILSVEDQLIKQDIGYQYLLQVWNKKGAKVYEKGLHHKPTLWTINSNYLVFKTAVDDEDSSYFQIVNLNNENATLLIKDINFDSTIKYIAFNNDVLYYANKSTVYLIACKHEVFSKKSEKRDPSKQDKQSFKIETTIWGLFTKLADKQNPNKKHQEHKLIIALETKDSQLDFNEIKLKDIGSDDFSYSLYQQNDVQDRPVRQDQITKFCYKIDKSNTLYGITLRQSAFFDIYWDMFLVPQQSRCIFKSSLIFFIDLAVDVDMSEDTFYFRMPGNLIKSVRVNGPSTNFQQAFEENAQFSFETIFYQNIKNHVNLYNSFVLIRTNLFVVHNSYISLYNIQEGKWLTHLKFQEGEIMKLIKKSKEIFHGSKYELMVILRNGQVYDNILEIINQDELNNSQSYSRTHKQNLVVVQEKDRNSKENNQIINMKCKIVQILSNSENSQQVFVLGKDDNGFFKLFYLNKGKVFELKIGLEDTLDAQSNIAITNQLLIEDQLILIQSKHNFSIYEVRYGQSKSQIDEFDEGGGVDDVDKNPELEDDCIDLALKFRSTHQNLVEGAIHSMIPTKDQNEILVIDEFNFYNVNLETQLVNIVKGQNVVGVYLIDEKYCYTLSHKHGTSKSGLRVYDLENVMKRNSNVSFFLQNAQVGITNHIDWNPNYSRLTFLSSLDEIQIVPALHRCTMAFIGMSRRSEYLVTKVIRDKFLALDKRGFLYCWSNITCKLLTIVKLSLRQEYQDFQIYEAQKGDKTYHREWYSKILIMKKTPEELQGLQKMKTIIQGSQNKLQYQINYESQQIHDYREFRVIEIISDKEVQEHAVFTHPVLQDKNQRIFFDQNLNFMLEIIDNLKVTLYRKNQEQHSRRFVKWDVVKRFERYPFDLETSEGFIRCLSPSFKNIIDVDLKNKDFIVRNSISMQFQFAIPRYLMNIGEESMQDIMKRFKWIDDTTIRIMNKEGIEKIIDLNNKCHEKAFNVIPLFELEHSILSKTPNYDYYQNRPHLSQSQVKERLIRKYQAYKSAYYLENKTKSYELYPEMVNIDYSVDDCKNLYVADFSFTFLSWRIIEKIQNNELDLKNFDNELIELICYNILPGGDTILHKLYNNEENILQIFKMAQPDEEKLEVIKVHMPFLPNFEQKSPMHICKDKQNLKNIDIMLKYLSGYKLDHHSRAIFDLIPYFINRQFPSLSDYLESRLMQTQGMKQIVKGNIPEDLDEIFTQQLWFDHLELKKRMKDDNQADDDVEMPISVEFIDMPRIYHLQDRLSDEFYDQLARTDQYEIFEEKTIRKMIEFNYPLVKKWTIIKLFVPFMIFQGTLFFYLNFIFEQRNPLARYIDFPMQLLLGAFSLYFLRNELTQAIDEGTHYFTSVWNYIDIITPTIILSLLVINGFNVVLGYNLERILQAVGVFFMWFKFLYFFRIFKSFGYLTRLIILVIHDMRHFLVVLLFTIVAFSDAFLTLSNGNEPDQQFVFGFLDSIIYTYRLILGDFDVTNFGTVGSAMVYGLFILCTVFNTIIMLNLLIAIISETFTMVKENSENASYQEMASMIGENAYLIPKHIRETYADQSAYLMIITELDGQDEISSNELVHKIDKLKTKMIKENLHLERKLEELRLNQNNQDLTLSQMIRMQELILLKLDEIKTGKVADDLNISVRESESSFKYPRMMGGIGLDGFASASNRESGFLGRINHPLNKSHRNSINIKKNK